jgi:uncharacterized membrane-anchored protein
MLNALSQPVVRIFLSILEGIIALVVCGVIEGLVFLFMFKHWTSGQNTAHQRTEDYNGSNDYLTNSTGNQVYLYD